MRLDSGLIWSLPIVLPISDADAKRLSPGRDIALTFNHKPVAIMNVQDNFERDTEYEIEQVYGTTDPKHPGVAIILSEPKTLIGGPVEVLQDRSREGLDAYLLTPKETRAIMDEKGWKTVVAFQTRNPIHRAHEYLQKCALEYVDGLLIHPVVGATKEDDLPADIRMKSYEVALEKYYPKDRVLLSTMKTAMRYAGPREAVFHIMVRKNFGCTHFIVGRDHAGVGDYYDTYGAHRIFDPFTPEELGITPIRFDHAFYCKKCEGMSTSKTCPHTDADRVILSGTKVRKMLKDGTCPPPEFTRPEVAALLIEHAKQSK
jgi:sulfate adenylyltransferase